MFKSDSTATIESGGWKTQLPLESWVADISISTFAACAKRSEQEKSMPGLSPNVDPNGLLEYSVVYTDRALNHMSKAFQHVMRDISRELRAVYKARSAIIVPGSGTFGMEAVARQFATGKRCLVIRNGWFSYRWSQIFDVGKI